VNSAAWHVKSWQCGYIPAAVTLSVVPVMCITGLYHWQSVFFEGLQSGEVIAGTSFLQALNIMPWCNGIHTDSYSATAEDRMSCKLCLSRYDPTHSSYQFTVFTVFMYCYSFFCHMWLLSAVSYVNDTRSLFMSCCCHCQTAKWLRRRHSVCSAFWFYVLTLG